MTDADYQLVYPVQHAHEAVRQQRDAKSILARQNSIDMSLSATKQPDGAIDLAIRKFVTVHPEFQGFIKYNYWAPRQMMQQILRISSCGSRKQEAVEQPQALEPFPEEATEGATADDEVWPEPKPRKKPGPKPKASVPTGEPALEIKPAAAPELKPEPAPKPAPEPVPEPISEPALNSAPEPNLEPVLQSPSEPVPEPAPKPLAPKPSLEVNGDDGEYFDLDPPSLADIDATMRTAANDTSNFVINIDSSDIVQNGADDDDDDDGGIFDMSKASEKVVLTKANPHPAPGAARSSPPLPLPPPPSAPAPVSKSLPVSKTSPASKTAPAAPASSASEAPAPSPPTVASPPTVVSSPAVESSPAVVSPPKPSPGTRATKTSPSAAPPAATNTADPNATSASATPAGPPRTAVAPFKPSVSASGPGLNTVWRGCTITPDEMAKFHSLAARQATTGTQACVPAKYRELTDKLAADPTYDPASDPDPLPKP
ncbi:hypothetical protein FRC09_019597, partial [Ceratobasidium sp. 395]